MGNYDTHAGELVSSKMAILEFRYGNGLEKQLGYGSVYVMVIEGKRNIRVHWGLATTSDVYRPHSLYIQQKLDVPCEDAQHADYFDYGVRAALADIQASVNTSELGLEILRWQWDEPCAQLTNDDSISLLELRMRPGVYSEQGFLGPTEALGNVKARDDQILRRLGLPYERVADELERVLRCVEVQRDKLLKENYAEYNKREYGGGYMPSLRRNESIAHFALDSLPNTDVGYLVENRLQVFIAQYRGLQECPWGCEYERLSSLDFLILNRQSGEYVTGPGLIVHLIRRHHFFEGVESPYRIDPAQVVQVLELVTGAVAVE